MTKLDRNINGTKYVVNRILPARDGAPSKAILCLPGTNWTDDDSNPKQIVDASPDLKVGDEIMVGGRGKYGLIKTRALGELKALADRTAPNAATAQLRMNQYVQAISAIAKLEELGIIEWGEPGTEGEFFVIKLRDFYAQHALLAYANEAGRSDREYARDLIDLVERAGPSSPFCKKPD